MAISYNITPWKWIIRYVIAFFVSMIALVLTLVGVYGTSLFKDLEAVEKIMTPLSPFVLLYQFVLFFFFRTRILRYVHILDQIDKDNNNNMPNPPSPPTTTGKDQKDFSYFR
jgi:hypothetical protein